MRKSRVLPASVQAAIERQQQKSREYTIKPKRGKYNNNRSTVTEVEARLSGNLLIPGESFDSDLEKAVCEALRARYGLRRVVRQVSITLPGGVRMRPDFMVLRENQEPLWIDAKGRATQDWKNKQKQLLVIHGIDVVPITSPAQVHDLPE